MRQTPLDISDSYEERRIAPSFSWLDICSHQPAHLYTVAKATDSALRDRFMTTVRKAIQ